MSDVTPGPINLMRQPDAVAHAQKIYDAIKAVVDKYEGMTVEMEQIDYACGLRIIIHSPKWSPRTLVFERPKVLFACTPENAAWWASHNISNEKIWNFLHDF